MGTPVLLDILIIALGTATASIQVCMGKLNGEPLLGAAYASITAFATMVMVAL